MREAAVLADEFALTHRISFRDKQKSEDSQSGHYDQTWTNSSVDQACFYCRKPGHLVAECPVLLKKNTKAVGLVKTISHPSSSLVQCAHDSRTGYEPFLSSGFVSLTGGKHLAPVRILRDTGAALSFLVEGVLPLSDKSKTGTSVLARGFEMGSTGTVHVGVLKSLPIPGVTFILGNDIGLGNIWGKCGSGVLPQVAEPDSTFPFRRIIGSRYFV